MSQRQLETIIFSQFLAWMRGRYEDVELTSENITGIVRHYVELRQRGHAEQPIWCTRHGTQTCGSFCAATSCCDNPNHRRSE